MKTTSRAPLVVSIASFCISVFALYYSQWQGPQIHAVLGPAFEMGFTRNNGFNLLVPVTLINSGTNPGSVGNAGIVLHRDDSPQKQYLMMWRSFWKCDKNYHWEFEGPVHPVAIPGKSSVSKFMMFNWDTDTKLTFDEGKYTLTLVFWQDDMQEPHRQTVSLVCNRDCMERLRQKPDDSTGGTWSTRIPLNQKLYNRVLDQQGVTSLLGIH